MSTYRRKETPLAHKRRWFALEQQCQLDFFTDHEKRADTALKKLEELKQKGGPKARGPPKNAA